MAQMTVEQASRILSAWLTSKPAEVQSQKAAMEYYGNYFKPENLNRITQDGFRDFLLLKNNRHWSGIHRQPQIYEDMDRLRECLAVLLDESRPFEKRLDVIVPKGKPPFIGGLGRAGCSRRSLCASTRTNTPFTTGSDTKGSILLGRNTIKRSDPFSKRYASLNGACHQLSNEIRHWLYFIDSMFSLMVHGVESPLTCREPQLQGSVVLPRVMTANGGLSTTIEDSVPFSLEKYLQDFIPANWDKTPLAKTLDIYMEDEEKQSNSILTWEKSISWPVTVRAATGPSLS